METQTLPVLFLERGSYHLTSQPYWKKIYVLESANFYGSNF